MESVSLIIGVFALLISATSIAQTDIIDIASTSKEHTTLVAAVKAADLVNTLKREGPSTIFAPTSCALDALAAGTLTAKIYD
jgi:uncharacterized surface protein with fasciclin (FAS1) repeats